MSTPPPPPLREGIDYTIDQLGRLVFTREYHLRRGYCCQSGCRHCPYGFNPQTGKSTKGRP